MKFMKFETFQKGHSKVGTVGSDFFLEAEKAIFREYEKTKKKLPEEFKRAYDENFNFHDMHLSRLIVEVDKNNKTNVIMCLGKRHYSSNYKMIYKDVLAIIFHVDEVVKNNGFYKGYFGCWLYDELFIENKTINHNIMLAGGKEINVKCKKIDIEIL